MPTVTSENREGFNAKEMAKKTTKKPPAGMLADIAWSMSSQKFPSKDAMMAHRNAAKAYKDEKEHKYAEMHEQAALSHLQGLAKNN